MHLIPSARMIVKTFSYSSLDTLHVLTTLRIHSKTKPRLCGNRLHCLIKTARLSSLTYLDLRGAECRRFDILASLPHLEILDITHLGLSNDFPPKTSLPTLPSLRALRLHGFTSIREFPDVLPPLPALIELCFSFAGGSTRPQVGLVDMIARTCPRLCHLSLAYFEWITVSDLRHVIQTLPLVTHVGILSKNRAFTTSELRTALDGFSGRTSTIVTDEILDSLICRPPTISHPTLFPTLFVE